MADSLERGQRLRATLGAARGHHRLLVPAEQPCRIAEVLELTETYPQLL